MVDDSLAAGTVRLDHRTSEGDAMGEDRFSVAGKVALVTGASYGLGAAFAGELAAHGCDLVLTARTADLLDQTAATCREAGVAVTTVVGDVTSEDDVRATVEAGLAAHGRIDVLVNNAGINDPTGLPAEQYSGETFANVIAVDLVGVYLYAREVGRHMLERGSGSIINISSMYGRAGAEINQAHYAAAKGGVANLTRQLGVEWADRGVRVNSLSPGFFVTAMTEAFLEGLGMTEYVASRTPMRRVGQVPELFGPLLFLASDASSYMTGADLVVDGGTTAGCGTYQVQPGHHGWGELLGRPMIGQPYEGLVPVPERFAVWQEGIPGIHRPLPEEA
jgi:NAD(P)-dependent dehydrogenase (short-subunit alcohol dehydrogenase family)